MISCVWMRVTFPMGQACGYTSPARVFVAVVWRFASSRSLHFCSPSVRVSMRLLYVLIAALQV